MLRYKLRLKLLRPDDGTGSGGGTTTTNPATTTGGGQVPNTQAGGEGAGTDPANKNQAATDTTTKTDDKGNPVTQQPKYTDDDMAAARGRWEADSQHKADVAAQAAKEAEAIEQGKAKEVAQTRLESIHKLEASVARMEPVLNERLDELTKEWPKTLLDKQPKKEDGYEARLDWYDAYKDIAADFLKQQGDRTQQPVYGGNGFMPKPGGTGANQRPVDTYMNNTYAPPKKQ